MKPIIKYKKEAHPGIDNIVIDGKQIRWVNTLFGNGRTTYTPTYYKGLVREKDEHSWWCIDTHIIDPGHPVGDVYSPLIEQNTTPEQRMFVPLTDSEKGALKTLSPPRTHGIFIRDDTKLWDRYQKNVSQIDTAIDDYIEHDYIAPWNRHTKMPGQTKKTGIGIKKLTNYSNIKILAKINEIIEFLEEKYGN